MTRPEVTIYTDGAAAPNPGPGGYGVVLLFGEHRKELSQGFRLTTNNRMELLAVISGLEALKKPCRVRVFSDSKYVVRAIEQGWARRWRSRGWMRTPEEKAKNADLWRRYLEVAERHQVRLEWVRGHAGVEENERCDALAVAASKAEDLLEDAGYEPPPPSDDKPVSPPPVARHGREDKSIKHREPGEPCRKCDTPLVRRDSQSKKTKPGQTYYYAWHLYCPGCRAMYLVDDAKRDLTETSSLL